MAIVSSGQITLVDNNDARPITAAITSNVSVTQVYSKDESTVEYDPNYTSTALVLTPRVYVAGAGPGSGSLDVSASLTGMKWSNTIGGASLGSSLTLTINTNQTPGSAPKEYFFEADYVDPLTGLASRIVCSTRTSIISTGTNAVYVVTSGNNVIAQSDTAVKNTVEIKADLIRAAGIDTTGVTYRWFEMPANVQINTSLSGYATKYGFKLTAGTGGLGSNVPAGSAYNDGKTIVIAEPAVNGIQGYRVECKDADAKVYQAYFTVYDVTDPYIVRLVSTNGDKLPNGVGSTDVYPVVYNGAAMVQDTTGWQFLWTYNDANGTRAGFVDTDRTGLPEGRPITSHTTGAAAVITLGSALTSAPVNNDMVKLVRANGTVAYFEVASATTTAVTLRVPATTSTFLTSTAPVASEFVGGKLFVCTGNGAQAGMRVTNGGATATVAKIVVTGFDIDAKGTINCDANRP